MAPAIGLIDGTGKGQPRRRMLMLTVWPGPSK